MIGLLARSSLRFFLRHPLQLMLSMLGIVLGVGIVTAVLITNGSASRAFALSSEALLGRSTHQILGGRGIAESRYVELRRQLPGITMAPVIEGHAVIDGQVVSLLGIDAFAEAGFGRFDPDVPNSARHEDRSAGEARDRIDSNADPTLNASPDARLDTLAAVLLDGALMASPRTRQRYGLGSDIVIDVAGREHNVSLVDAPESRNPLGSEGLLIGDIGTVQELLARPGRIDRIDLILADQAAASGVEERLPVELRLDDADTQRDTMAAMTRGFQINLTAMSLLALVVGAFLIHNTMTFAVLQRRELFATLRITGVSSRGIFVSVLAEAALISAVASILGLAIGYTLARQLVRLTTQTINDLYFVLHVQALALSPWVLLAGVLLGIGTSLLAASLSALDAAAISPLTARQRSTTERRTRTLLPLFAASGLSLMLIGGVLALLPVQSLLVGFGALMLLIVGYGLSVPWVVRRVSLALRSWLSSSSVGLSFALGSIERNISRTGLAIAALCIAVSATFGVDVMIGSFRDSVERWLGRTLQSDLYLSTPTAVASQASSTLDPRIREIVTATADVESVSTGRSLPLSTSVGRIDTLIIEPHPMRSSGFEFLEGEATSAWDQWQRDDAVLISEPLATKTGLSAGDSLQLFTELEGNRPFRIVGVVRDYGSSHGQITLSRSSWGKYWNDQAIGSLGVLIDEEADVESVINRVRARLEPIDQPILIRSNRSIREASLAVFDRTFEVTHVLRLLTVGVAFVGIFSALLALHLERGREYAILRASGATRLRLLALVQFQTACMGLYAGLLALPLGWLMSSILIHIINVRSFGWSMQAQLPEGTIVEALGLALLSALLAGLYPAWRLSRTRIASQLREE